ncbi:MAG: hypothetical protein WCP18_00650 [bacterium]
MQRLLRKFKSLVRKNNEEVEEEKGFAIGLTAGLVVALVVIVVVLAVAFWPKKDNKEGDVSGKNPGTVAGQDAGTNLATPKTDPAKLQVIVINEKNCPQCWDTNLFLEALKNANTNITKTDTFVAGDSNADKLISKYKITKLPTVLVSGELDKDASLSKAWSQLGDITSGTFVLRQVVPPYIDVASGKLKGKISVTYLTDKACTKCYDVFLHDKALQNLSILPVSSTTVDVSSDQGKALVAKYKIRYAPTILLSGEMSEYASLQQLWSQVGTVASDGAYVFTKLEQMQGSYMDLQTNKLVTPAPTPVPAATTAPAGQ